MADLTSRLLVRLIDGVSGPARAAAKSLLGIGASFKGLNGLQANLQAAIERNNQALAVARGNMVDAAAAAYALYRGLSAPLRAASEFETQLEDIGQKADIPREKLAALGAQIRKVARDTNQSASTMAGGLDTLVGFGAREGDALALLGPIGRAATAYRASVDDLAKAGYAALDNLRVPAGDFAQALDAMAQAGKEGAFELRDMARYFPSLGAAYQGLNQKGVPAVADLAAALQVVRKGSGDSAEAATNLSNVLQKIRAPATIRAFKKMGVNLEKELAKAAKKGLTPIEAIAEITQKTLKGDLGRLGFLFEDAQVQKGLRAIIQNMDEYRRIRAEAMKAQGIVEADYERRLQTSLGALQRFRAVIENLNASLGAALLPGLAELADKVAAVAIRVAALAEAHPQLVANVVQATAALVGIKLAMAGLSWLGLNVRGVLLASALAAVRLGGGAAIAAKNAVALQAALGAMSGQKLTAFQTFATALRGMIWAVPGVSAIAGALGAVGSALAAITAPAWVAIAVGVGLVAAAGAVLWRYWDRISAVMSGVAAAIGEQLAPAIEAIEPALDVLAPVGDAIARGWESAKTALSSFGEWIGSFFSREVLSDDQKAQWAKAGHDAATGMIEAIKSAFSGLVGWAAGLGSQIAEALLGRLRSALASFRSTVSSYLPSWAGGGNAPGAPAVSGARAAGGPIYGGRSYLVGEKGPEVITAGRSGYVHPNGSLGGGSVSIGDIIIQGASDPQATAEAVYQMLSRRINEALRGVQSDYGLKMT